MKINEALYAGVNNDLVSLREDVYALVYSAAFTEEGHAVDRQVILKGLAARIEVARRHLEEAIE